MSFLRKETGFYSSLNPQYLAQSSALGGSSQYLRNDLMHDSPEIFVIKLVISPSSMGPQLQIPGDAGELLGNSMRLALGSQWRVFWEARPGGGNWKHFYSAASELPLVSPLQPIPHAAAGGIFLKQAPDHCTPLFQNLWALRWRNKGLEIWNNLPNVHETSGV